MKFKIDGRELSADGMTVNELCEAEQALKRNMTDGTGAAIAVQLYVAMRREDPHALAGVLADQVGTADVTTLEEVEEESPPADTPAEDNGAGTTGPESLLTSGPRPSVRSA